MQMESDCDELPESKSIVEPTTKHSAKYRAILCISLCLHSAIVAFNHTEPVFLNYTPQFSCKDNESDIGCVSPDATCDGGYEFVGSEITVVTQFSLVCSRAYLRPLSTTLYFVGVTAGALVFGPLADRFGRRAVMLLCLYAQGALGLAQYFADSFVLYVLLRTMQGAFVQGLQSSTFTLLLEIFPGRRRTGIGVVWEVYWAFGCAFMAGLAWLLMDWRWLQLALTMPTVFTILYSWTIPESGVWRATVRRSRDRAEDSTRAPSLTLLGLFTNPLLRKHSAVMNLVWFSVALCYYGTVFYLPNLAGQRHMNFLIGAAIEVVSYVIAYWILSRFGRRIPLAGYQLLCGLMYLSAAVMKHQSDAEYVGIDPWLTMLLLLSKGCAVSCFCCLFLYSSELFPTCVRGAALGMCGFFSRIGSLTSPQLITLGDYTIVTAPLICLGIVSLASGLGSLFLPETLGKPLPNTLREAEAIFKKTNSN